MQKELRGPANESAQIEQLDETIQSLNSNTAAFEERRQQLKNLKRNIELKELDEYLIERDLPTQPYPNIDAY